MASVRLENTNNIDMRYGLGFAVVIVLASLVAMYAYFGPIVEVAGFLDTDNFTRLVKLRQFWHQGGWFDPTLYRIDYPNGHATHWTKPLDALLLAGAMPMTPLLGFDRALHFWATIVAPITFVFAVFLAPWISSPLLQKRTDWLATAYFACQWTTIGELAIGRPDHNIILTFCWLSLVGLSLRAFSEQPSTRLAFFCSIFSMLGIWTSLSFLVPFAALSIAIAASWLFGRPEMARFGFKITAGTFLGLLFALPIEYGPDRLFETNVDEISWIHLVLFAITSISWGILWISETTKIARHLKSRLGLGLATTSLTLLFLGQVTPELFRNPSSLADPLYASTRLNSIAEYYPAVSLAYFTPLQNLGRFIFALLAPLIGLAGAIVLAKRSDGRIRWAAIFLAIATATFLFMTLAKGVHWAVFSTITTTPIFVLIVRAGIKRAETAFRPFAAALARIGIILGLMVGPGFVGNELFNVAIGASDGAPYRVCNFDASLPTLRDPHRVGASAHRIVAFVDFNPEILYWTPHYVYSIPNHRPQPGYRQTYELMAETNPTRIPQRLQQMKAEYILICTADQERAFYKQLSQARNFHDRLVDGEGFWFLQPIALPSKAELLRFYKVAIDFD